MTTNNAVNSGLSGTTGTGNFVGSTSPSLTTPKVITGINDTNGNQLIGVTATGSAVNSVQLVNAATANNPSLSATGSDSNVTLLLKGKGTGGAAVLGTSTNDNAGAGYVGEFMSSNILVGSAVSLSTGMDTQIATISLTAGDWDAWGWIGSVPASGTVSTSFLGAISLSAALPTPSPIAGSFNGMNNMTSAATQGFYFAIPIMRVSISTTTPIYLVANSVFSVSTQGAYGFIAARRVR